MLQLVSVLLLVLYRIAERFVWDSGSSQIEDQSESATWYPCCSSASKRTSNQIHSSAVFCGKSFLLIHIFSNSKQYRSANIGIIILVLFSEASSESQWRDSCLPEFMFAVDPHSLSFLFLKCYGKGVVDFSHFFLEQ